VSIPLDFRRRLARAISGADRYRARALTTPLAVRNAIVYVLQNHLHHRPSRWIVDECSSARWFTGWAEPLGPPDMPSPVAEPTTWLARVGWRRHGRIRFEESPVSQARARARSLARSLGGVVNSVWNAGRS